MDQCGIRGYNGYQEYTIKSKLRSQEVATVARRYSAFEELVKLLCMQRPGCILPALPHKSTTIKLAHIDSDEIMSRRAGLETFLKKLILVGMLAKSTIIKSFLTEPGFNPVHHTQKINGKELNLEFLFSAESSLSDHPNSTQDQGTGAQAYLFSLTRKATKLVGNQIWGSDDARRKELFGEHVRQAQDEICKFKQEEDFVSALHV